MYCGEWIESHALHLYLLHAPDFLGYESAIHMAADHPALVERGLATRKAGNRLLITIGGRAEHPINPRTGGFYRAPTRDEFKPLVDPLQRALEETLETVALRPRSQCPTSSATTSSWRSATTTAGIRSTRADRLQQRAGHPPAVVRRSLRRGASRPFQRPAQPPARRRLLYGRAAGTLQPRL